MRSARPIAGRAGVEDAALPGDDFHDGSVVGHAHADVVARGGEFGARRRGRCPLGHDRSDGVRAQVEHLEIETTLDQTARHRATHCAQPDVSDRSGHVDSQQLLAQR